jgi:uncharacterized glyoxalase superfamily protein PhnB
MLMNRSVPVDTVLPHVFYEDAGAAVEWLERVFGFVEHYRYGDPVAGAQMRLEKAWVMVAEAGRPRRATPLSAGQATQMLTVFVEDVDRHYARVKAAGAKIIEELQETVYGERQFGAEDLDGHWWIFSCHAKDLAPEDWGARIAAG